MDEVEELASGPPDLERRRGRPPLWPLLLVGALALGWFLLPDTTVETPTRPVPLASSPPSYQPGYRGAVPTLESVCTPVTNLRSRLTISFVIINRSGEDLQITGVEPALPMGGLRLRSMSVVRGGCRAPLDEPLTIPLDSGSEALVVFRFALPAECPQPYPVGARITSQVPDISRSQVTTDLAVYPDLGSIRFSSCE